MKPLVTVFLMAYNEEDYIDKAISSIINQETSFDFEVLCHDDASTDGTKEIISYYKEKFPEKIKTVFQKKNQMSTGLSDNLFIRDLYPISKGKYISYCDGDDYWTDKNKLQKQVVFLENHPDYMMCTHAFDFIYEDGSKTIHGGKGRIECDVTTEDILKWNNKKIPQLGTAVFRKEIAFNRPNLFHGIGGGKNSLRAISDFPLYVYLSLNGKIRYLPDNMSIWRRRTSGTWQVEARDVEKAKVFNDQYINFLKELNGYTSGVFSNQIQRSINSKIVDLAYVTKEYKDSNGYIWNSNCRMLKKIFMQMACICPSLAKQITVLREGKCM